MTRGTLTGRRIAAAIIGAALLGWFTPAAAAFMGWTVKSSPNPGVWGNVFKGVTATSATAGWAVGASATQTSNQTLASRWNGTSWTAVTTPNPAGACQDGNIQWAGNTLNAVDAVSATDVWAVGNTCYQGKTLVEHWNGTSWSIVPSPSFPTGGDGVQNVLNGVVALSSSNVWAVGFHTAANGRYVTLIERWNGTSWRTVRSPSPSATANVLRAVAASGPSDVWAVGYQRGTTGSQPLIERWNGTRWSVVPSPPVAVGSDLFGVAAISSTDVWAVGTQPGTSGAALTLVLHWNGSAWSVVSSPNLSTEYGSANVLRGVAGISSGDVWAVGMFQNESTSYHQHRALTLHWNGTAWSVYTTPSPGASAELQGVASLPTGQLFGVGLFSKDEIDIYNGVYYTPETLALKG
jgi:hypothetical protein